MLHGAVPHARQRDEEGRESYLSNDIIFKLVVLTLMSTYRLQKAGENRPGCIMLSWKHALGSFVNGIIVPIPLQGFVTNFEMMVWMYNVICEVSLHFLEC